MARAHCLRWVDLLWFAIGVPLVSVGCAQAPPPWRPVPTRVDASTLDLSMFGGDGGFKFDFASDGGGLPVPVNVSGACATVTATDGPRCATSARVCIEACASDRACIDRCVDADTTAAVRGVDCQACYQSQTHLCLDRAGCHDAVAKYRCCAQQRCPAGSPATCAASSCGLEKFELDACSISKGFLCAISPTGGDVEACFP